MPTDHAPIQGLFFRDFNNSYIPVILQETYIQKIYEPYLKDKKDLIIVDAGGYCGETSFYFKDYAKTVYCIEPSKQHLECAEEMIKYNKIENIKLCSFALSNVDGKSKLYHRTNTTMFSLKDVVDDTKQSEEVETKTIKKFMEDEKLDHIDFLKLDTEGFESEIIASPDFKEVADKIKIIVGEWHQWTTMSQQLISNSLRDLGFKIFWLNTDAKLFVALR